MFYSLLAACADRAVEKKARYFGVKVGQCWIMEPSNVENDASGSCYVVDGTWYMKCNDAVMTSYECTGEQDNYFLYQLDGKNLFFFLLFSLFRYFVFGNLRRTKNTKVYINEFFSFKPS